MIVSNEPGYYEDGNFGVRIENLLIIKQVIGAEILFLFRSCFTFSLACALRTCPSSSR